VQTTGEFDGNEYQFQADESYEIPRENIALGHAVLGEGNFGLVVMAEAKGIVGPEITSIVAVKKLKDSRNESDVMDFVKEMEVMKIIGKHENIINLLGCCSQDGELLVIVEYALHGCLQNYLRKLRPMNEDGIMERNPEDTDKYTRHFVNFGYQIARGMEYLASKKVCLVTFFHLCIFLLLNDRLVFLVCASRLGCKKCTDRW
jgi:serine/threonine protein kinase